MAVHAWLVVLTPIAAGVVTLATLAVLVDELVYRTSPWALNGVHSVCEVSSTGVENIACVESGDVLVKAADAWRKVVLHEVHETLEEVRITPVST